MRTLIKYLITAVLVLLASPTWAVYYWGSNSPWQFLPGITTITGGCASLSSYTWHKFTNDLTDEEAQSMDLTGDGSPGYGTLGGSVCLHLTGSESAYVAYASIPAGLALKAGDDFTIAFRANFDDTTAHIGYLVAMWKAVGSLREFGIQQDETNAIKVLHGITGGASYEQDPINGSISSGVDYAIVYNEDYSTGDYDLYVYTTPGGVFVGYATGTWANVLNLEAVDLYVGDRMGTNPYQHKGDFDDLRIWNELISNADLTQFVTQDCGESICIPTEETESSCSDLKDNDCNGLVDALDPNCTPAETPDYYVTQNGTYPYDGSASYPFSVGHFNALTGSYAGKLFSFSGSISSEIDPQIYGTSGSPVILDGYAGGDCDTSDGTWPSACSASAASIDTNGDDGFIVNDANAYLTIQDFEISDAYVGVNIYNDFSNITVKRLYIHDSEGSTNGNRAVYATFTDGAGDHLTIGGAAGDGIIAKDIGWSTGCADIEVYGDDPGSTGLISDVIISHNHLYATKSNGLSTDRGIDGITLIRVENFLIEYNKIHGHNDRYGSYDGENGMDIKGGSRYGIIRFNNVYDELTPDEAAILIQTGDAWYVDNHDIVIYGNNIHENEFGLHFFPRNIQSGAETDIYNIFVFGNLVTENKTCGILAYEESSGGYTAGHYYDFYLRNNTIYGNAFDHTDRDGNPVNISSDQTGLRMSNTQLGQDYDLENNIFANGRIGESDYRQIRFTSSNDYTRTTLNDNHYYSSAGSATVYNGSSDVNPTTSKDTNGTVSDPDLDSDYMVNVGSPVINVGDTAGPATIPTITIYGNDYGPGESGVYYINWDIALLPSSTLETGMPSSTTYVTGLQGSYTSEERGAFIYVP